MGKVIADDDELPELSDSLDGDEETLGLEDGDELGLGEIEEGPEEIGLDVETLAGDAGLEDGFDDDEDAVGALDDAPLELDDELDEEGDEGGWTEESEGSGASWDDDALDGEEDGDADDDGGLEGVEDPLLDDFVEEGETRISIDGDDDDELEEDHELERIELDLD